MKPINQCHCCLQRPSAKELTTPNTHLGITEIYSAMIEECFVIKLTSTAHGESGICEVCLERLREACLFKMQVQNCQAELQDRLDGGLSLEDEDCIELPEDLPEDDVCSESSVSSSASAAPLSLRARQQIAFGCSVRLERLRIPTAHRESQPCPVTSHRATQPCRVTSHRESQPCRVTSDRKSQPCPVTSHRESQPSPVTSHRESQPRPVTSHRESHAHTLEEQAYTHDTRPTLLTNDSSLNTHKQETITRTPVTNVDVYCCDMCSRGFTSKVTLIRHLLLHTRTQPPVPVHTCNVCKESFVSSSLLKKHSRFHSEDRPHVCAKCNKRFRTKDGLLVHSESHTEDKPYTYNGVKPHKCTECDAEFAYKPTLDTHMRRHFGRKYECDVCEKKYSHQSASL
ncbi:zinc finger protein 189-like [Leguminivora glycinivorella]|uniref:zinc finger protein 189-like n=1 Tax=Leguminivora glycinivorella TaxID=1035111 RepID=UPI00200E72FD|nr:zinc finger protein 189-like [Leguminivora glycinivorella]